MVKQPAPKILILDIEWRPTTALVWQAFKVNVGPEHVVEHGGLLCVGAKWLGEKKVHLFSDWEHGHIGMLEAIHAMMSEADLLVGFNSNKFDIPKLEGEFVLHGLPPVPPCSKVDCYLAVKKFGYFMNRLAFIGPFMGVGGKLEHEGMGLWKKVMAGDENAQRRMARYCCQDVSITEKLYIKIRPHIRNHPNMATGRNNCPECDSPKSHRRGKRPTRAFLIQRLQCQNCGHWFDGERSKIG